MPPWGRGTDLARRADRHAPDADHRPADQPVDRCPTVPGRRPDHRRGQSRSGRDPPDVRYRSDPSPHPGQRPTWQPDRRNHLPSDRYRSDPDPCHGQHPSWQRDHRNHGPGVRYRSDPGRYHGQRPTWARGRRSHGPDARYRGDPDQHRIWGRDRRSRQRTGHGRHRLRPDGLRRLGHDDRRSPGRVACGRHRPHHRGANHGQPPPACSASGHRPSLTSPGRSSQPPTGGDAQRPDRASCGRRGQLPNPGQSRRRNLPTYRDDLRLRSADLALPTTRPACAGRPTSVTNRIGARRRDRPPAWHRHDRPAPSRRRGRRDRLDVGACPHRRNPVRAGRPENPLAPLVQSSRRGQPVKRTATSRWGLN